MRYLQYLFIVIIALFAACEKNTVSTSQFQLDTGPFRMVSQLFFPGERQSDVWGYSDAATGRHYAIVGHLTGGISIVDVTQAERPTLVGKLSTVPGFDIKVWGHYVYTVTGSGSGLGAVVDISDPSAPVEVGKYPSAHNIFITDKGFLVAESPGVTIYDLNGNPERPNRLWSFGAEGHDATVVGNRLFDFHGGQFSEQSRVTRIFDISDPAAPTLLTTISDPNIRYHHSGWPSADGRYLFICDELSRDANADMSVWDISDIVNPRRVGEYGDTLATVHNVQIIGEHAFVAYYSAGLRIFDISDPLNLVELHHFDTSESFNGPSYNGAFGIYAFAPGNALYVSDIEAGLFIFTFPEKNSP